MERKRVPVINTETGVVSIFGFTIHSLAHFLTKYSHMKVGRLAYSGDHQRALDVADYLNESASILAYRRDGDVYVWHELDTAELHMALRAYLSDEPTTNYGEEAGTWS